MEDNLGIIDCSHQKVIGKNQNTEIYWQNLRYDLNFYMNLKHIFHCKYFSQKFVFYQHLMFFTQYISFST